MKRISSLLLALLLCLACSVMSFAENIYIVDDDDDFVPPQTTQPATEAPETTTKSSFGLVDPDALGSYFDDFADKIGGGIDSILSGFGQWQLGNTASQTTTQLQQIDNDNKLNIPSYNSGGASAAATQATTTAAAEEEATTAPSAQQDRNEVASVLIVNQAENGSAGISGSTLTLVVFISAVIILILVVIIVLVFMTRRTEFNSAVMNKSTIPSVERPDNLAGLMDDDTDSDGVDYGNIAYWDSSDFR